MKRSLKDYLILGLKGMGMGAADVVPGVSGGTIAFISGIYEDLINSINSIKPRLITTLFKQGIKPVWKEINGGFLFTIVLGVLISVLSLAKGVSWMLTNHPVLIWAFFFGLIVASIPLVAKQVKSWDGRKIFSFTLGAVAAFYITTLEPQSAPDAKWYVFLSGAIAICAMILPGISGSFILLLLGSYPTIINAIGDREVATLAIFAGGCIVGLLAFSRLLGVLFRRFHDLTIALLSGFLLGSLNKVWPWKQVNSFRLNRHDECVPFLDENVLPGDYVRPDIADNCAVIGQNAADPQLWPAIGLAVAGFLVIFLLERVAGNLKS